MDFAALSKLAKDAPTKAKATATKRAEQAAALNAWVALGCADRDEHGHVVIRGGV